MIILGEVASLLIILVVFLSPLNIKRNINAANMFFHVGEEMC